MPTAKNGLRSLFLFSLFPFPSFFPQNTMDKLSEIKVLSLSEHVMSTGVVTNWVTLRIAEGIQVIERKTRKRREEDERKKFDFLLSHSERPCANGSLLNFRQSDPRRKSAYQGGAERAQKGRVQAQTGGSFCLVFSPYTFLAASDRARKNLFDLHLTLFSSLSFFLLSTKKQNRPPSCSAPRPRPSMSPSRAPNGPRSTTPGRR